MIAVQEWHLPPCRSDWDLFLGCPEIDIYVRPAFDDEAKLLTPGSEGMVPTRVVVVVRLPEKRLARVCFASLPSFDEVLKLAEDLQRRCERAN